MKKKILALCLCVAMLAIAIVGGTLAYFTDTDDATNTFTAGNVEIDLTEAVVKTDEKGNLVADGDKRQDVLTDEKEAYDYGKVYPGQTIYKDPTIENLGSEDAYVAARITVTDGKGDIHKLIGSEYMGLLYIEKMVSGGIIQENAQQLTDYYTLTKTALPVYGDDTYAVYQIGDMANGTYTFYVFFEKALATNEKVTLFDTITINKDWDNAEMAELAELQIKIEAFATQEYGFDNCFTAITTAFANEFPFAE